MIFIEINCRKSSPFIIYSSPFELCYPKLTVIFCSALPSLSFSSKATNYFSVSLFFSMPDWAAFITEFSMPAAFSGFTVFIFITWWIHIYIFPWLPEWEVVSKWPVFAPQLLCIIKILLLLLLFHHFLLILVLSVLHSCQKYKFNIKIKSLINKKSIIACYNSQDHWNFLHPTPLFHSPDHFHLLHQESPVATSPLPLSLPHTISK